MMVLLFSHHQSLEALAQGTANGLNALFVGGAFAALAHIIARLIDADAHQQNNSQQQNPVC